MSKAFKKEDSESENVDLLREAYEGKEPLFDIAGIESVGPGGERESFDVKGKSFPALVPAYTDDGGHLNALGRKVVAEKLLVFLAGL